MNFPTSDELRARLHRVLRPKTKMGKVTLWFGCLAGLLEIARLITRSPSGTMLSGWTTFIAYLFVVFALLLGLRYLRRVMMWRLRNRLIVTYVFIGVIPLILLVAMAFVAGYLFAGQFATYVATSNLQSELQHLEATNKSLAAQFRTLARDGKLSQQLAGEIASASDENFRHRSVSVWDAEGGFVITQSGRTSLRQPIAASPKIAGDFAGIVMDNGRLQLRAVKKIEDGPHHLTVISNQPITPELLQQSTAELGSVTLYPPNDNNGSPVAPDPSPPSRTRRAGTRMTSSSSTWGSRSLPTTWRRTTRRLTPASFLLRPIAWISACPSGPASTCSTGRAGSLMAA